MLGSTFSCGTSIGCFGWSVPRFRRPGHSPSGEYSTTREVLASSPLDRRLHGRRLATWRARRERSAREPQRLKAVRYRVEHDGYGRTPNGAPETMAKPALPNLQSALADLHTATRGRVLA